MWIDEEAKLSWTKEYRDQIEAKYRAGKLTIGEIREAAHHLSWDDQRAFIDKLAALSDKYPSSDQELLKSKEFHEACKWAVVKLLEMPTIANA